MRQGFAMKSALGMKGLTFDMSGRQKAQPFGCPLDGGVSRHFGHRSEEFNTLRVLLGDAKTELAVKGHGQPIGLVDVAAQLGNAYALNQRREGFEELEHDGRCAVPRMCVERSDEPATG